MESRERVLESVWCVCPGVWRCLLTQRLVSFSHLRTVVGLELGVEHGVERGQQMLDISCRPAGLFGGPQPWVILKDLPCLHRLAVRCRTASEEAVGEQRTGRSWGGLWEMSQRAQRSPLQRPSIWMPAVGRCFTDQRTTDQWIDLSASFSSHLPVFTL